eukprot:gene3498-6964_t
MFLSRRIMRYNLVSLVLVWILIPIFIGSSRNYDAHKIPIKEPTDLPLSKINCNDVVHPNSRRCVFSNVMVYHGEVWIISDNNIRIPEILCSAVDSIYPEICPFRIGSKESIFKMLTTGQSNSNLYGINTESALHFSAYYGVNVYHALFEGFLPIFEILKSNSILSTWLNESNNHTIKLINYANTKHQPNPNTYNFTTPFIASELRDAMLHKADLSNDYRSQYSIIKYPNSSISFLPKSTEDTAATNFTSTSTLTSTSIQSHRHDNDNNQSNLQNYKPKVVIIQRRKKHNRVIFNLNEIVTIITNITGGIPPKVVFYEALSISTQIKQTFSTDILIMIHGGALANAMYLPPYATLIDIYPYAFPYHIHGLVNWIRYTLRDIPIAHAPFDIINPNHMLYNGNHSLPLCIQPPGTTYLGSFRLFWQVSSIIIDPIRFKRFFEIEYKKWKSKTNYIPPISREDFLNYSKSFKELWYNDIVRSRNINKSVTIPDCNVAFDELRRQIRLSSSPKG